MFKFSERIKESLVDHMSVGEIVEKFTCKRLRRLDLMMKILELMGFREVYGEFRRTNSE